jgi:hypothetical protein
MKTLLALAACCALLSGCAVNCGADWHQVGLNDGRIGADSQIESYAARCGGSVDRARYAEGLQSGLAMRPRIAAF